MWNYIKAAFVILLLCVVSYNYNVVLYEDMDDYYHQQYDVYIGSMNDLLEKHIKSEKIKDDRIFYLKRTIDNLIKTKELRNYREWKSFEQILPKNEFRCSLYGKRLKWYASDDDDKVYQYWIGSSRICMQYTRIGSI